MENPKLREMAFKMAFSCHYWYLCATA